MEDIMKKAIERLDIEEINEILETGFDVNKQEKHVRTKVANQQRRKTKDEEKQENDNKLYHYNISYYG
jgi:hypothetical protein